jgi:hypothetical protein
LNAEDLYASLVFASQAYFSALIADAELQAAFLERVSSTRGGMPQVAVVVAPPSIPPRDGLQ